MHVIKTFAQILHIFLKIKKNNVIAKKKNKPYLLTFGKVKVGISNCILYVNLTETRNLLESITKTRLGNNM